MQSTFRSRFFLSFLLSFLGVVCASVAYAQAPPDEAHIYAAGPTDMAVEFTACQTSDALNCYLDFSIYRNPPGFTQSPVWASSVDADLASHTIYDTGVKAGQTYTYQVCAGGYANSSRSNCIQTNTVKTPTPSNPPPGGSSSGGSGSNGNNGNSSFAPPTDLQALATTSSVYLKWTNPPHATLATTISVLRTNGATAFELIKQLDWRATSYADSGSLLPHTGYMYAVCEGYPAQVMNNCVQSKPLATWGADPILTATRVNATTVRLSVAVDNFFTLFAMSVTREGSDDPCRQGTTLANGEQGCRTQTIGPNGVPVNAAIIVTVYQHSGDWGSNSTSAPWVIDIPDDTVKAGVEYYYQAHVTWVGPKEQDSAVETAPAQSLLTKPYPVKILTTNGIKPIKPSGGAKSAPVAGRSTSEKTILASPTVVQLSAVNLDSAITNAKKAPGDAQALYSLGQAYCAKRLTSTCVSLMYMGLLQAQKAGNSQLITQISNSLAQQGVNLAVQP